MRVICIDDDWESDDNIPNSRPVFGNEYVVLSADSDNTGHYYWLEGFSGWWEQYAFALTSDIDETELVNQISETY